MTYRLLFLLSALWLLGCGRWQPNTPVSLKVHDPTVGYEATLYTLRASGYQIAEADSDHGFIRAYAKLNKGEYSYSFTGNARSIDNWILVQVYRDGRVAVWPEGDLVRNDGKKVHKALRAEVIDVTVRIGTTLRHMRDGAILPDQGRLRRLPDGQRPPPPRRVMLPRASGY